MVASQKLLKDKHLKLALRKGKARYEAIRFNCAEPAPARIRAAFPDWREDVLVEDDRMIGDSLRQALPPPSPQHRRRPSTPHS